MSQESSVVRPRASWDSIWLRLAFTMAERTTCSRAATGAVIVTVDNQVISTGYNGAPRGLPHCTDVGCMIVQGSCRRAMHAEANAIIQAAQRGVSTDGATIYCTTRPCVDCAKAILQAGIQQVYYTQEYRSDGRAETVRAWFLQAKVRYTYLDLQQLLPDVRSSKPRQS